MRKISMILIFIGWAIISFGQGELKGTWILESYAVDKRKPSEIKNRMRKEKITFDTDGRYLRTYREEELPDGTQIHMTYSMLDEKFTKKYFDKDGCEIKAVSVRKKTHTGTYEMIDSDEIRFSTAKDSYIKMFKIDSQYLSIADTLDNRVIWRIYKKQS